MKMGGTRKWKKGKEKLEKTSMMKQKKYNNNSNSRQDNE